MQITIPCVYKESYLPTPKCRKLRWRDVNTEFKYEFPEVSACESPAAFIVKTSRVHARTGNRDLIEETYYAFAGELWAPLCINDEPVTIEMLPRYIFKTASLQHRCLYNLEHLEHRLMDVCSRYIIRDGVVCQKIGEPMYVIISRARSSFTMFEVYNDYNRNIGPDMYYTALQREEAIAAAKAIALDRGHEEISGMDCDIEVLLPDMVRRCPEREYANKFLIRHEAHSEAASE